MKQDGRELWYCSPIRSGDSTPSFKVDTRLNLWYDHGLAQGGNIIDLVCELKSVTVSDALALLERTGLGPMRTQPKQQQVLTSLGVGKNVAGEKEKNKSTDNDQEGRAAFTAIKVQDLQHPALIQYLKSRAINVGIARMYLNEVYFKPEIDTGQCPRHFFALGFPCGDGYDVRSAVFKGFVVSAQSSTGAFQY